MTILIQINGFVCFNELLSSLVDKHAPLKRIRIRTQPHPWYDNDIRDARLKRRKCEKYWKMTNLQSSRLSYTNARNTVNNLVKKKKSLYYRHKLQNANSKDMFGIVSALIKPQEENLPNFVSKICQTLYPLKMVVHSLRIFSVIKLNDC